MFLFQVEKYEPEVVWSDGEWGGSSEWWGSTEFLAWLYNDSPVRDTVVTNDRWGTETSCAHGGFYSCTDNFNPGNKMLTVFATLLPKYLVKHSPNPSSYLSSGVLQKHKWENCMTLDKKSWGFRRNARIQDYNTPHQLITALVETVACGGRRHFHLLKYQLPTLPFHQT